MKKQVVKFLILISFMISGCSVDLKTKELINTKLKEQSVEQSVSIIDNYFNLTYVENHAIAFGLLGNLKRNIRMPIIIALPLIATLVGFLFIWKIRRNKFKLLLPVFIILGGAYGNILDRIMNGYVTDFLHLHYFFKYNFYVFNVADMLINIGLILILFQYKEFNKLLENVSTKKTELKLE